jgi:hypothetical protein
MFPLVEFPELVQQYAPYFENVFSAEAFLEFERYISGLIVSENKTVDGINRLFVMESRNQSSLNRLLTESPFSLEELNTARLRMLDSVPGTQIKPKGVLGLDDTLLMHYGQDFEKIAKLFDHVTQSYVWAHDLVTVHYSDDETDYPVQFQLWEPVELEKVEAGLRAAGIELKASKESLRESDPNKWRGYLFWESGSGDKRSTSSYVSSMTPNWPWPRSCSPSGWQNIRTLICRLLLIVGSPSRISAAIWIENSIWPMWERWTARTGCS